MSPEVKRGPVSPQEAADLQIEQMPGVVFDTFNKLIARNLMGGTSRVLQKEVVEILEEQGYSRADIYKQKWLDVEDSYRAAGWKVVYDKPAAYAGESYEPSFEFTTPEGGR